MMDDDVRPIRNFFRTLDFVAMNPVWLFLTQGAFTRAEVLRTINDHLVQDGGQSDEVVVPCPGALFVEYVDEGEQY